MSDFSNAEKLVCAAHFMMGAKSSVRFGPQSQASMTKPFRLALQRLKDMSVITEPKPWLLYGSDRSFDLAQEFLRLPDAEKEAAEAALKGQSHE